MSTHLQMLLTCTAWIVHMFAVPADGATYLVASFPRLSSINYVIEGDQVWRPLVASGLQYPNAITIDKENKRLYVYDTAALNVFWYFLKVMPNGMLITDGIQRIAMKMAVVRGMNTDTQGNLLVSGKLILAPPAAPEEAVMSQSAVAIAGGVGQYTLATQLWTVSKSVSIGDPTPKLTQAIQCALDPMHTYWANTAGGSASGSIVRGALGGGTPAVLADNVDSVLSMAITPSNVFYGAKGGIYAIQKTHTCSAAKEGSCHLITKAGEPTALVFDGEGTIYVADSGTGEIFTLPAGSILNRKSTKVIDAPGIFSLALYSEVESGAFSNTPCAILVMIVIAMTNAFY